MQWKLTRVNHPSALPLGPLSMEFVIINLLKYFKVYIVYSTAYLSYIPVSHNTWVGLTFIHLSIFHIPLEKDFITNHGSISHHQQRSHSSATVVCPITFILFGYWVRIWVSQPVCPIIIIISVGAELSCHHRTSLSHIEEVHERAAATAAAVTFIRPFHFHFRPTIPRPPTHGPIHWNLVVNIDELTHVSVSLFSGWSSTALEKRRKPRSSSV